MTITYHPNLVQGDTVSEPGIYRMSAAAYHRGPCPGPELSNSIAQVILNESPLHAYTAHSKLGNAPIQSEDEDGEEDEAPQGRKSSNIMELGSAIHKIVLGYGADLAIADPKDHEGARGGIPKGWTNKSIRGFRADALAEGKTPILKAVYERAIPAAGSIHRLAESYLGMPVGECLREVVLITNENGHWRKAMLDIVRPDLLRWADLKTTSVSLKPESLSRFLYNNDLDFQLAFYGRMLDNLDPKSAGRRKSALLFGETKPPFATGRPMELSEAGLHRAQVRVARAVDIWDECLASGIWPGFGEDAYSAEPAAYLMNDMENYL